MGQSGFFPCRLGMEIQDTDGAVVFPQHLVGGEDGIAKGLHIHRPIRLNTKTRYFPFSKTVYPRPGFSRLKLAGRIMAGDSSR